MQKSCLIDQEVHGSILKALKITFTDKKKKKKDQVHGFGLEMMRTIRKLDCFLLGRMRSKLCVQSEMVVH